MMPLSWRRRPRQQASATRFATAAGTAALRLQFQCQHFEWLQVKDLLALCVEAQGRLAAFFFPRAASAETRHRASGEFQQTGESGGKVLRMIAWIAQRKDRFLLRP